MTHFDKDYVSTSAEAGKVKLPEIGFGVSHSTDVPESFQKLNNLVNNFNSDPYALRINKQQQPGLAAGN